MIKKMFTAVCLLGSVAFVQAQTVTPEQYIEQYRDLAIREMKRMGVPASITLAQGLLETQSGNSILLKKSNNHFGIKCKSSWTGGGVSHDDDAPGECFRTYKDAESSYRDHSNYLRGNDRYASLFRLDPADYKGWSKGLKKAGYATDPKYPQILISNIERYNLQQYTLEGMKDMPKFETGKYEDDKELPVSIADDNETGTEAAASDLHGTGKTGYINGNKCVFAKKGTSLLAIATNHDVQLSRLLEFNDLEEDGILEKDAIIFVEKKSKKGTADFYTVLKGESLHDVSQKSGIQMESLLEYNGLHKGSLVDAGTKLYLREMKTAAANSAASSKPSATAIHEVKPKEGLYAISKKYGVTVKQLREWNSLASDNLSVGQQLIVSK